jgi:hypothetical protein
MKKTIVFIMVAMLSLPVTLADEVANETVSSESTSTSTTVMPSTPIIKQTVPQIIRTFLTAYWWIVLLIVIIIIYIPLKYNGIINLKNHRIQAFSDIDVQLKLRFDLVPNLVETVKGYASHEQGTLEKVIQARSSFQQAGNDIDAKLEANNQLM